MVFRGGTTTLHRPIKRSSINPLAPCPCLAVLVLVVVLRLTLLRCRERTSPRTGTGSSLTAAVTLALPFRIREVWEEAWAAGNLRDPPLFCWTLGTN